MFEAYIIHLLIMVGIYLILAVSLQLAVGFSGLLNFGHIAFYGVGAYVSALLALAGFPFWVALPLAGLSAASLGALLAWPTNRLKGDYLALATIGFSFVVYAIANNWTSVTNGSLGLSSIPKPVLLGYELSGSFSYFLLVAALVAITYLTLRTITASPYGKALEAIRDNEISARALGKSAFKMKSTALAVSAFFAGVAGSLYAHYITFIDPTSFTVLQLIPVLAIVIIGGLASLKGTIIATFIIVLLPEPLRFIGFSSSIVGPMRQMLYALILITILIYRPRGFFGRIKLE